MTTYRATIRHDSIARARVIDAGSDLTAAKAAAIAEFGDEMRDCRIIIIADQDGYPPEIVAERRVDARKWTDHQYGVPL